MHCEQFVEFASDWLEGQRSSETIAHRSACARCSSLIADLEAIQAAAPALRHGVPEPPERVWLAVRAELEAEGILRPQQSVWQRLRALVPAAPRPALVGSYAALAAAALLLVVTGGGDYTALDSQLLRFAPPAVVNGFSAQLEKVEQKTLWSVHAHDPAIAASYRQNMAIVDNIITVCKKKIEEDPQNDVARDYLLSAYQQKADLIADIMDRGTQGD
jgi:hypothetical protein